MICYELYQRCLDWSHNSRLCRQVRCCLCLSACCRLRAALPAAVSSALVLGLAGSCSLPASWRGALGAGTRRFFAVGRMTWVLWQCFPAPRSALQGIPAVLVASKETPSVPCITLSSWGIAAPGSGRASTGLEGLKHLLRAAAPVLPLRTMSEWLLKLAGGAASKAKHVLGQRKKFWGMFSVLTSGNLLSWSSCCCCAARGVRAGIQLETSGKQPPGSGRFCLMMRLS